MEDVGLIYHSDPKMNVFLVSIVLGVLALVMGPVDLTSYILLFG